MPVTDLLLHFNWTVTKIDLSRITGLPDDTLHVLAGMLVLTIAALVLRRPPWDWRPWLIVVLAETINEAYDLSQVVFKTDEGNFRASLHDFWLTLLWPTIILLIYPRFVRLDHESGPFYLLRRIWHTREFQIGFGVAAVAGLVAAIYLW
jgi:hypothetical protein